MGISIWSTGNVDCERLFSTARKNTMDFHGSMSTNTNLKILLTLFSLYYFLIRPNLGASILMPSVLIPALLALKAINVVMRSENPGSAQGPILYVHFQMLAAIVECYCRALSFKPQLFGYSLIISLRATVFLIVV